MKDSTSLPRHQAGVMLALAGVMLALVGHEQDACLPTKAGSRQQGVLHLLKMFIWSCI